MYTETAQQPLQQVHVHGNSATANKLATSRNIALTGAITGSSNFDGSGNIAITTSMAKTIVDYLYSVTYTNNANLILMIKSLAENCTVSYVHDLKNTAIYYYYPLESYCVNLVRYLITILPSGNSHKTLLSNWIANYQLTAKELAEEADVFIGQTLIMLTTSGASNQSTFKIENNNYSLPYLIDQLRKTI